MTVTSVRDGERGGLCLFGGAFNPPHLGHLACARLALTELPVGRLLLMPLGRPAHKDLTDDPGGEHRLAMCRLLADEVPGAQACDLELARGGVTYTVDTLRELRDEHGVQRPWLLLGADAACSLTEWHQPREVVALSRLAVIPRAGIDDADVLRVVAGLGADGCEPPRMLAMEPVNVSSSLVRDRAREGAAIDGLVPASVAAYVREHGLYARSALESVRS